MAGRKSDFTLPTLDDLFSTQELRDDAKLSKIRDIPLELIDDFPDHPFKVRDDEDISAREMKEHNILAIERFQDSTQWMIEFSILRPCSYGSPGDEMRLFLTEDGYQAALVSQKRREIKIKRYARVIEGHVLDFKPDKRRRHP